MLNSNRMNFRSPLTYLSFTQMFWPLAQITAGIPRALCKTLKLLDGENECHSRTSLCKIWVKDEIRTDILYCIAPNIWISLTSYCPRGQIVVEMISSPIFVEQFIGDSPDTNHTCTSFGNRTLHEPEQVLVKIVLMAWCKTPAKRPQQFTYRLH